jgi:hypothetical protein
MKNIAKVRVVRALARRFAVWRRHTHTTTLNPSPQLHERVRAHTPPIIIPTHTRNKTGARHEHGAAL